MNGSAGGNLQNVLSISTAANNRYLLHFNSLNSLTQWTAGIRLAMYEHATLQEAYTGSLIAGKGKLLNNIRTIMERSKWQTEDWARVRFGAGTPWRRCWCVITPPDEKDYAKAQKTLKKHAYDRKVEVPKGVIKFYDTRKVTKKTRPIATISDAHAAYAIYPQSKPLIDQSTLVKLEGMITIHTSPESTTEGFLFVMPEVHPAVTGFEMMLRWLFPVFDTFALYGRPTRLIADTLDQRGLMFAMPRDRRYGYLDILDVSGLIHTEGSQNWSERQWRVELKKLTSHRMNSGEMPRSSRDGSTTSRRNTLSARTSMNFNRSTVKFDGDQATHSQPVSRNASPTPVNDAMQFAPPRRVETAPQQTSSPGRSHNRSASDALGYKRYQSETPSRLSYEANNGGHEYDNPPPPPAHGGLMSAKYRPKTLERVVSEAELEDPYMAQPSAYEERTPPIAYEELEFKAAAPAPVHVASPPAFLHSPNSKPANQPHVAPELRRANSAMDAATLQQLAAATGRTPHEEKGQEDFASRQVVNVAKSHHRVPADASTRHEGMVNRFAGHKNGERLNTIPASPFEYERDTHSPSVYDDDDAPPPVPYHGNLSQSNGAVDLPFRGTNPANLDRNTTSPPPPFGSSLSINRKPVPQGMTSPEPARPSFSSEGSLRDQLIDQAALERILQSSPSEEALEEEIVDDDSTDGYASSKAPSPKKTVERPRVGRLKTVGNPDIPLEEATRLQSYDTLPGEIPDVDFGPTLIYKPTTRPSTSGSITPGGMDSQENSNRSTSRLSMLDGGQRNSYLEGRKTPTFVPDLDQRRSVAWQPTATTPVEAGRTSVTPEQWVQYRASIASQPMAQSRATPVYGHSAQQPVTSKTPPLSRNTSGDWSQQARMTSKTPPLSRATSGDWTQQAQRTPPPGGSRPHSRNASAYLNPPSPGRPLPSTQSSHLSAREQMHIARATGTPMLSLAGKDRKQGDDSQAEGLIGAMAAREREKAAAKEGMRSSMVQQAIVARQQQQAQAEMEAQMQAHYQMQQQQVAQQQQLAQQQAQQMYQYQQQQQAYQSSTAGHQQMPSNYAHSVRPGMMQQRSSGYIPQVSQHGSPQMHPGAQAFAQGGGWGAPQQQQAYGASYYQQQGQQRRY